MCGKYLNREGNEADESDERRVPLKQCGQQDIHKHFWENRSISLPGKNFLKVKSPSAHARACGFLQGVGYKLSVQKMSNADTVKVDGRKGLSMRGTNGFTKLAVPEKHRIPTQNLVVVK